MVVISCLPLISFSELLAGWEAFGASQTNNTTQASANAWGRLLLDEYGARFTYTARGSGDDTFGTVSGATHGTPWLDRSLGLKSTVTNKITIIIENAHASDDLVLEGLHFDAWRAWSASAWRVDISSREGNISGENIAAEFLNAKLADPGFDSGSDFDDFDVVLTNLTDHVLAPGEKAWLDIVVSKGTADWAATYFDNIALTGSFVSSPVPTPPPPAPNLSFEVENGQGILSWSTVQGSGYVYNVYYSTNLFDEFSPMETNLADTVQNMTNALNSGSMFYRVTAQ